MTPLQWIGFLAAIGFLVSFIHYFFLRRRSPHPNHRQEEEQILRKQPLASDTEGRVSILCKKTLQHAVISFLPQESTEMLERAVGVPNDCVLIFTFAPRHLVERIYSLDGVIRIEKAYVFGCPDS